MTPAGVKAGSKDVVHLLARSAEERDTWLSMLRAAAAGDTVAPVQPAGTPAATPKPTSVGASPSTAAASANARLRYVNFAEMHSTVGSVTGSSPSTNSSGSNGVGDATPVNGDVLPASLASNTAPLDDREDDDTADGSQIRMRGEGRRLSTPFAAVANGEGDGAAGASAAPPHIHGRPPSSAAPATPAPAAAATASTSEREAIRREELERLQLEERERLQREEREREREAIRREERERLRAEMGLPPTPAAAPTPGADASSATTGASPGGADLVARLAQLEAELARERALAAQRAKEAAVAAAVARNTASRLERDKNESRMRQRELEIEVERQGAVAKMGA